MIQSPVILSLNPSPSIPLAGSYLYLSVCFLNVLAPAASSLCFFNLALPGVLEAFCTILSTVLFSNLINMNWFSSHWYVDILFSSLNSNSKPKSQLLVWTECLPPHPHPFMYWHPSPCVVVFGDGVSKEFKIKWGHKGHCFDSISVLIRRDIRKSAFSLSLLFHPPPHTPMQERPCEPQWDGGHVQAMKSALTRDQICWHHDCGLLAFRSSRK